MENNAFVLYLDSESSPASFAIFKSFFFPHCILHKECMQYCLKVCQKKYLRGQHNYTAYLLEQRSHQEGDYDALKCCLRGSLLGFGT